MTIRIAACWFSDGEEHENANGHWPSGNPGGCFYYGGNVLMGFLSWLGISPRDAPHLPEITDNVRDSGQTFVFGRADSGERVN